MTEFSLNYILHNKKLKSVILIIEPWAEKINIPADKTIELFVLSPLKRPIETIINEDYIVIWLWSGCIATVSLDGQDCTPLSLSIPVPK